MKSIKSRFEQPPLALGHDPGELSPVLDWIDSRFGPIRTLSFTRPGAPEPAWWIYYAELGRTIGRFYRERAHRAMGSSLDGSEALRRVLGEAVERYCCFNSFDAAEKLLLTFKENPVSQTFPYCAEGEPCSDALKSFDSDVPLNHVKARRLTNGESVWLPAAHVHLDFRPERSEIYRPPLISSGMAFHKHLPDAIWSGLCEVAERDAIMLMWLLRLPVQRLRLDADSLAAFNSDSAYGLRKRIKELELCGLTPYLFEITTEFKVPSVFCILESSIFPFHIAGASVDSDPLRACCKAIDETITVRFAQRSLGSPESILEFSDYLEIHDLQDRANLYGRWLDAPPLRWLLQKESTLTLHEFSEKEYWEKPTDMDGLSRLAAEMEKGGLTPYWSDLTLEDVVDLGRAVKVVVPEMIPLAVPHAIRWLGTQRLSRVAGVSSPQINPDPHPFA